MYTFGNVKMTASASTCWQCGDEAVEQRIRLRALIDLREMAGVLDNLDADGRDAGAERIEIRCDLALTHRPTFALFVAVGGLYCHGGYAQCGHGGGEATDIVAQQIPLWIGASVRRDR